MNLKEYFSLSRILKAKIAKMESMVMKIKNETNRLRGEKTKIKNEFEKVDGYFKDGVVEIEEDWDRHMMGSIGHKRFRVKIDSWINIEKSHIFKVVSDLMRRAYDRKEEANRFYEKISDTVNAKHQHIDSLNGIILEKDSIIEERDQELQETKLLLRQLANDPTTDRAIRKLRKVVSNGN